MAAAAPAPAPAGAGAGAGAAGAGAAPATAVLPNLFPFVFVGCWNQPGEEGAASPPRDIVAAAITSIKDDIQFVVLGGDNVYPKPTKPNPNGSKTKKKHEYSVFEEGMSLYTTIGKPIIPAFGNHNVELIEKEKQYFKVSKTYDRYDFADNDNIHIFVLDTNIIIDKRDFYDEMLDWFRTQVSSLPAGHEYFVVQHEPYFTARLKGTGELVNADPFLDVQFSRPPIAILCADTHHYQHATIQSNINPGVVLHQFIVGTGGANSDKHFPAFTNHEFQKKYTFTQVNAIEGFGFLRITSPDPAAFEFIKVMDWIGMGGRRKSRRQRLSQRPITRRKRHSRHRRKNAT
jgi:hypothetical protein